MSAISDKYALLGGATGLLGPATTGEVPAANGGRKQEFHYGAIYWHPTTGAFEVHGAIRATWLALGAEGAAFGYPVTDETPTADGIGRFSDFERASIYWHPGIGACDVRGPIRQRWRALGAENSSLGYPVAPEAPTADGAGRVSHFEHGSILWSQRTGAHEVLGPIRSRWTDLRRERGMLGYPTAAPYSERRDRTDYLVALFERGQIDQDLATQETRVVRFPSAKSPNYEVPLVAYRVSDDDGSRPCSVTAADVRRWVDEANEVFSAAGVRFAFSGTLLELRDTDVNHMTGEGDPNWASVRDRLNVLAAQQQSVVVVFRFGPGPSQIGGGFSSWGYDFVAMSFFDQNALGLLAHELGHHFGLPHTFGPTFSTVRDAEDYVLGGRPVAALDGDQGYVDDTPADPFIAELQSNTSVQAVALGGQVFALARSNIMSYWAQSASGELSHGQIDRVRQIVRERQQRYLAVAEDVGFEIVIDQLPPFTPPDRWPPPPLRVPATLSPPRR